MARPADARRRSQARTPARKAASDGDSTDGPVDERDAAARVGTPAQGRELRARGKRTMRRLLDAGTETFATRGYHQARVDDIVKLAKTSHGTFYLYFANKEELFRALAMDVADDMIVLAEAFPEVRSGTAGYRELRAWLERFTELYQRSSPIIRAWTEAEIGGSEFGRLGTDVWGEFTRGLTEGIRRARPPGLDPTIAAIATVAMIERFNYYVMSEQVDVDRDAMLDTLARVTHDALAG